MRGGEAPRLNNDAALDVARRYARTHGPFTTAEFAARYALGRSTADALLKTLAAGGRLLEGEFRPGGAGREWCDPDVLQTIRRRSLAKLRKEVEPVEPPVLARLVTTWQGLVRRRAGLDALLDVVENLQGAPLPASILESEILSARIEGYSPGDLDALAAAGEVVWRGVEPVGDRDGRVALYMTDHLSQLWRPPAATELSPREEAIAAHLRAHGASFFASLHEAAGGGYPGETVDALWDLVWKGIVTNDTFHALRAFTPRDLRGGHGNASTRDPGDRSAAAGWRRPPPRDGGRCSRTACPSPASDTQWSTAMAQQLLARYGVVTREVAAAEGIAGGFGAVYDVLKALEDAGRVRRGYFVGVGATQFASPPALELLRSLREMPDEPETLVIAATDTANPYGTTLKWPAFAKATAGQAPSWPKATAGQALVLAEATAGPAGLPGYGRGKRGDTGVMKGLPVVSALVGGGRADAHGRRAGRARQRRARGLCPARRAPADGLSARGRAGALDDRPRAGPRARETGAGRASRRPAPRRDQRARARGASPCAVPDRGGLQSVGHGVPDAKTRRRRGASVTGTASCGLPPVQAAKLCDLA